MALVFGRQWTKTELRRRVGHMDQLAGIRAVTGADGTAQQVRALEVYTASGLTFRVMVDRALDIGQCRYQGMPLAWASPTGDVHPAYYETEGLGWLRSFAGGLITTCGLDHFGSPTTDQGEAFGIHGRISHMPAQQVSYRTFWQEDDYVLEVTGKVRQARLFGENLVLERRITTALGSRTISIEDTVHNEGFQPQPHMILYHCNIGFPLIDAGTKLQLNTSKTVARDADAAKGLSHWQQCQAPTTDYQEQVFRHEPMADEQGWARAMVDNPKLGLGLQISYYQRPLPHLFQWKMMGEGAYVMGIEPANSSAIEGRAVARERGDLPMLSPGEARRYHLNVEVLV